MFLDGQCCIGVVDQEFDAFADKVRVGPVQVPDGPGPVAINHTPRSPGNTRCLSADSANPEAASNPQSMISPRPRIGSFGRRRHWLGKSCPS